jgi:GNAT superfamily N-acetyltransferase
MTPGALIAAMEATWPPAAVTMLGPAVLREGQGGGKRVSAASVIGAWRAEDLDRAEAAMRAGGQAPLFQVLPDQAVLDAELARRGYGVVDPVLGYAAPVAALARPVPRLAAFPHWPPLEIARDIWAEAGIGPARIAVMERVAGPKVVILARASDRPAGVAFVAVAGGIAMLHALDIRPDQRRKGAAGHVLAAAAAWAGEQGAQDLSLVVTQANAGARALYAGLGMQPVAGYHYREHKF